MKKLWLFLASLPLLWSANALAGPCVIGALSSYISLGSVGCTIGNASFSSFSLLEQPTGATPFASITLTPVITATSVGLDFDVNTTALGNQLFENLIAYQVAGLGSNLTGASASLNGSSATADGAVTAVQNYCVSGVFLGVEGLSGCSGIADSLIVFDTFGSSSLSDALAPFTPAGSLAVVSDIAVDGGTAGSASLVSASNRFDISAITTVPEPGTVLLVLAILPALLASLPRRKSPSGV